MAIRTLLESLGPEIEDPEEETFLLFSRDIPSQDLGFVDSRASTLDLVIADRDYVIHQSPAVLSSKRAGGTTGAVLWKITPMFSEWIVSPENPLWKTGALNSSSSVIELGCGISGLVGLVLASTISRYVLTDQPYVSKLVESNLKENEVKSRPSASASRRKGRTAAVPPKSNLTFTPLDWELDEVTSNLTGAVDVKSFDVIIACDCIYNDALIQPLVQTCMACCRLRVSDDGAQTTSQPAICIVAQQLRDPEVFEGWIREFHRYFRTWRIPESALSVALGSNNGFVIHVGILRE
ncbi:uncharacterized protein BCR38DRAFT_457462 [Pseudomassariella vexata]|uniref:Methyltransferase-domain-containing protein n=1 Tax=Pseudomassariella vexata TaxID=1141098 RepID=A0A1Y2E149_9PEZI|nr:uncharacterized protein BCR38DRAFT_457462 [Pseudomassariella vexata]ORY65260.1 hypothetical protein BCR38DRAFT_457462 [Pseudomassariella vexata]